MPDTAATEPARRLKEARPIYRSDSDEVRAIVEPHMRAAITEVDHTARRAPEWRKVSIWRRCFEYVFSPFI